MPFLNNYKVPEPLPVAAYHSDTPLEAYDLNFAYDSTIPRCLSTTPNGIKLYPIIPSLHAKRLFDLFAPFPESYRWLPYGPFESFESFLTFLESVRRDPGTLLFVVYDLSLKFDDGEEEEDFESEGGKGMRKERIAGIVGILKSVPANRSTEIGHLHIPPPFQRTHVLTHSISALLSWLLDPPTPSSPYNLGLRRVQWFANSLNVPSVKAALRIGFGLESDCLRWERITLPHKEGLPLPSFLEGERKEEEEKRGGGRHSSVLSIGWDRWSEGGVREKVNESLQREVKEKSLKDVNFGDRVRN
ncbi:hypothetical protein JCM3765_002327 [Sporobolomyces pararoseus]